MAFTRHLRQSGFTDVAEVANGQEALDLLAQRPFELVLLDPPFDAELEAAAVQAAAPLVGEGGFLYLESAAGIPGDIPGFSLHRSLKAGAVHAQLFHRQSV